MNNVNQIIWTKVLSIPKITKHKLMQNFNQSRDFDKTWLDLVFKL